MLKTILNFDKSQTELITGRYIGHSTRLVYNIMYFTKKTQKEGFLVLTDFEKCI